MPYSSEFDKNYIFFDSFTIIYLMLITVFLHFWSKGYEESHSKVVSLSPAKHLVRFEPGTL